jgi:hypothetical protein
MYAKRTSLKLTYIAVFVLFSLLSTSAASAQTPQTSTVTVRESDSLLNGALIGASAGVASGLLFCSLMEPWEFCRQDTGSMIKGGAIGAGIGIAIDAVIRKKVYQTASGAAEVYAGPIIGRRAKGMRLSVSF